MKKEQINYALKLGASAIPYGSVLLLGITCADYLAAGLEEQVTRVGSFVNGPMLKTGMGLATIAGTITAAIRGSMAMAAGVMGVGIALAYYLGWLNSGSFVQTMD